LTRICLLKIFRVYKLSRRISIKKIFESQFLQYISTSLLDIKLRIIIDYINSTLIEIYLLNNKTCLFIVKKIVLFYKNSQIHNSLLSL